VFVWRKVMHAHMQKRFVATVMDSLKLWRKSWGFKGISLTAGGGQTCQSPKGDWRAFAATLGAPTAGRRRRQPSRTATQ
jgi:hypothetical protein